MISIPQKVYLTVHSIDERLEEEGIYRVSGASKNVQGIVNPNLERNLYLNLFLRPTVKPLHRNLFLFK